MGRQNWASYVKSLLCKVGFGYLWEMQHVENEKLFLAEFSQRLYDCERQTWMTNLSSMSKLRTYSLYKFDLSVEEYLTLSIPLRLRASIARFRIGVHELEIEQGRHRNAPVNERLCKLCLSEGNNYVEDEYHVLMVCPFYTQLRDIYINGNNAVNLYNFVTIMSATGNGLINLCSFIANMFKVRKSLLMSL
jgi:hypothetical protein